MCVLSQDNESKRVFERLYETGVVQVKKRHEEQEEKRIKEDEVDAKCSISGSSGLSTRFFLQELKHHHFKALPRYDARSRRILANGFPH